MNQHTSRLSVERAGDAAKIMSYADDIIGGDPDAIVEQLLDRILHYCLITGRNFDEALDTAHKWVGEEMKL